MQQQAQALADHEDLLYVGFLPFADVVADNLSLIPKTIHQLVAKRAVRLHDVVGQLVALFL